MPGSIVLIEGTDCTGKSQLAKVLAEMAGPNTAVFHAGPPATDVYVNEYILPLVIATNGWNCICDRWHLGEPVWAKLFNRKPILAKEQLHIVEKRLEAFGVPITPVYLERNPDDITAELLSRGEDVEIPIAAINQYEDVMRFSKFYWHRTTLPEALAEVEVLLDGA